MYAPECHDSHSARTHDQGSESRSLYWTDRIARISNFFLSPLKLLFTMLLYPLSFHRIFAKGVFNHTLSSFLYLNPTMLLYLCSLFYIGARSGHELVNHHLPKNNSQRPPRETEHSSACKSLANATKIITASTNSILAGSRMSPTLKSMPLTINNLSTLPTWTMSELLAIESWLSKSQEVVLGTTKSANFYIKRSSPSSYSQAQAAVAENPSADFRYSQLMHPMSYLDFAAKHNNSQLAEKECITTIGVSKAIDNAAHYIASRDGTPVISVFQDFEKSRLNNAVHTSHRQYVAAVNRRARSYYRACGISKPDLSKSGVPCKLQGPGIGYKSRCTNHPFCSIMKELDVAEAAWEAEEEEKAAESTTVLHSGQNQPTTTAQSSDDRRGKSSLLKV